MMTVLHHFYHPPIIVDYVMKLTELFLSDDLMVNFLFEYDTFLISLHGNPMVGVNLKQRNPCGNKTH